MKKNNFGWSIFVLLVVCWSLFETYPPTSRDLVQQFAERAEHGDAAFTNILERLAALQTANTNREFANLLEAAGTNNLQPYFPFLDARNELHPNRFLLNRLQRDASGKIKLG